MLTPDGHIINGHSSCVVNSVQRWTDGKEGGAVPPVTSAHNMFFLPQGHLETRETLLRVFNSLVSQAETSAA